MLLSQPLYINTGFGLSRPWTWIKRISAGGVDSAGRHSTMNHAALSLERFPSTMGYDDPPHLVTMSVRFTVVTIDLYAHIVDGVFFFR